MDKLVFKLLYRHVSLGQTLGFFLANWLGLAIVLCGWQFYRDASPVLSSGDSFMKKEYAVVSKKVNALNTLTRKQNGFSAEEQADLQNQPFVERLAAFTPARFSVYAAVSAPSGLTMGTEMFFESLPDDYIDADLSQWNYEPGSSTLPVILPRSYLNLYNFGYARARNLPTLTEGMVGMVNVRFDLAGSAGTQRILGRVVGFSNRLNTILVPQSFLEEANARLAPDGEQRPARLAVELKNPADARFAQYLQAHGLEAEASMADGGRAAWFLQLTSSLVMGVGVVICALAFYVLLLSVFLLLQKHTERIRTLLLIGYSPQRVGLPFHLLAWSLHLCSLILALCTLCCLRSVWTAELAELYPQWEAPALWPAFAIATALFALVAVLNYFAVRRKVGASLTS